MANRGCLFDKQNKVLFVISALLFVVPAFPPVIPAKAGMTKEGGGGNENLSKTKSRKLRNGENEKVSAAGGMGRVKVRVFAKAKQNRVEDAGGFLRVRTTAAPIGGRANIAAAKLLSDYFGVAKSGIKIIRGETSRDKVFEIG